MLENKPDPAIVKPVEKARRLFLNNNSYITVLDLGSGSLKMGQQRRRISDIASFSSTRKRYIKLLSGLAGACRGKPILELGTSLGIGTMAMALSAPESMVTTIEACPNISELAGESFSRSGLNNINMLNGPIDDVLLPFLEESEAPGLVFIDANHSMEPLLRYFDIIADHADNETVVVIDDIHLSRSMEQGWRGIRMDKRVKVTIDVLQMGLVLFRSEMRAEDFVVRY